MCYCMEWYSQVCIISPLSSSNILSQCELLITSAKFLALFSSSILNLIFWQQIARSYEVLWRCVRERLAAVGEEGIGRGRVATRPNKGCLQGWGMGMLHWPLTVRVKCSASSVGGRWHQSKWTKRNMFSKIIGTGYPQFKGRWWRHLQCTAAVFGFYKGIIVYFFLWLRHILERVDDF